MKKLFAIAILGVMFPGAAFAQTCQASGPADLLKSCIAGGVAQLSGLSGAVTVIRAGNLITAENGMKLVSGDRVIARGASAGNLNIGGAQGGLCSVPLSGQSSITISRSANNTCATQRTSAISNPAPQASVTPPPVEPIAPIAPIGPVATSVSPLAIGIGGAVLAGGAGLAIAQSRSDRLSP